MKWHPDLSQRREGDPATGTHRFRLSAAGRRVARPIAAAGALALGVGGLLTVIAPGSSTAGASGPSGCGALCVINPSGTSLSVTGNGSIDVQTSGANINSTSPSAANVTGNGTVNSPYVDITGNYTTSGNGSLSNVSTGVPASPDPLAGILATEPLPSGPSQGSVSVGSKTATAINPGVYSSITVSSNGQLTLSPGYYVITGNISISGKGSLTGNGVFLYMTCASYPTRCNGAAGPSVAVSGNGTISISPPDGSCPAISLAVDPTSRAASSIDMTGDAGSTFSGIVYAASSTFVITGNGSPVTDAVDVGATKLTGNGNLIVTGDASFACDSLTFVSTNEPTDETPATPIAGGAAGDYLPNGSTPIQVDAVLPGGSVDTSFDGSVTLSIEPGFSGEAGTLGGIVTEPAVNGVASFPPNVGTGISVSTTGAYALNATSPGANPGDSAPFVINSSYVFCAASSTSCSAFDSDGTIRGAMNYTNNTGYDEWISIDASASPPWTVPGYTFGPSSALWTSINYASTAPPTLAGSQDVTSVYTVDGSVAPGDVNPTPPGGVYRPGYADSSPWTSDSTYGTGSFGSDGVTYKTGIMLQCVGDAPTPPCYNSDYINGDQGGRADFEYLATGDPAGRDG